MGAEYGKSADMVQRHNFTTLVILPMIDGGKTMVVLNLDDTYMTVYDPTERVLELLQKLTSVEGLFIWNPQQFGT